MIDFPISFDVSKLKGTTTIACAEEIMEQTISKIVSQKSLVDMTALYSKADSKASVRGTLFGSDLNSPEHKIRGKDSFKRLWVVCKRAGGSNRIFYVARGSKELKDFEIVKPTYDTPNKKAAREKGCLFALKQIAKPNPSIITLAGPQAVCARDFLLLKPKAVIKNLDINKSVLESASKFNLNMENIHVDIGDYLRNMIGKNTGVLVFDRDDFTDLINYDTDGYFCETLSTNLEVINKNILCDWLVVTIQADNIRNHGKFADNFRRIHGNDNTAIPSEIEKILSNYKLHRHFTYNRTTDSRVNMRTMIFKLELDFIT